MTSSQFRERLTSRAHAANVPIESALADRFEAYYRLLATWNKRINLTSLDLDSLPADAVDRLFIEPLAAARFAERETVALDVGSGGGSPAIPFAIAAGVRALTMVESKSKKSVFLREAARAAALSNATVVTARFETMARSRDFERLFQLMTVRAVRIDERAWRSFALPLCVGGSLFLFHRAHLADLNGQTLSFVSTNELTANGRLTIFSRV